MKVNNIQRGLRWFFTVIKPIVLYCTLTRQSFPLTSLLPLILSFILDLMLSSAFLDLHVVQFFLSLLLYMYISVIWLWLHWFIISPPTTQTDSVVPITAVFFFTLPLHTLLLPNVVISYLVPHITSLPFLPFFPFYFVSHPTLPFTASISVAVPHRLPFCLKVWCPLLFLRRLVAASNNSHSTCCVFFLEWEHYWNKYLWL